MPDPKEPDDISYPDQDPEYLNAWLEAHTLDTPGGPLLMHPASKAKLEEFLADDAIEAEYTEFPGYNEIIGTSFDPPGSYSEKSLTWEELHNMLLAAPED